MTQLDQVFCLLPYKLSATFFSILNSTWRLILNCFFSLFTLYQASLFLIQAQIQSGSVYCIALSYHNAKIPPQKLVASLPHWLVMDAHFAIIDARNETLMGTSQERYFADLRWFWGMGSAIVFDKAIGNELAFICKGHVVHYNHYCRNHCTGPHTNNHHKWPNGKTRSIVEYNSRILF